LKIDWLNNIRITDFSWNAAGPYATLLLGFMGAEVIKIESAARPDPMRTRLSNGAPDAVNVSRHFTDMNLNKLDVTLDLAHHEEARQIARQIIGISDVVVENFRPGVMERFGLAYHQIREFKPDIIMVSSSARGSEGPEKTAIGFASVFGAIGGLSYITGYPDSPPAEMRLPMDLASATVTAFATMAALVEKETTGEGQFIDLSSAEVPSCFIGELLMDYTVNGRIASAQGNRDSMMAPHNCYPCQGEDKWASIAIGTDEEWHSLCQAMGYPQLEQDSRFSDAHSRWQNQEELDRIIAGWTANYTDYEVMEVLQNVGVAAVPSFNNEQLYNNPHLQERNVWLEVAQPVIGSHKTIASPWLFGGSRPEIHRHAPLLGEHNDYVLGDLLGMSTEEITRLKEAKVVF
jgi:benzylsuccinate CoA-transferase BbsF subunit